MSDNSAINKGKYAAWDRVKVSKDFFDLLISHPVFRREPKAVNMAQFWLCEMDAAMGRNNDQPVTWFYKDIQNRFQQYSQTHTEFRNALRDLELITFTPYRPPANESVQGECRKFTVTPLGRKLLADGNYQWLYKLLNDPEVRRRNQVAISRRKPTRRVYADPMKRIIDEFNHAVKFDRDGLLNELKKDDSKKGTKEGKGRYEYVLHILLDFQTRWFNELEVKEGRIYHSFIALPSEYRPFALFEGKPYVATVDIRACWPTFLGKFLWDFYEYWMKASRLDVSEAPPKACEVADYLKREVNLAALKTECAGWTKLFTDTSTDPRDAIMAAIGIQIDRDDMKQCLNTWLNGAKKYQRVTDGKWNMKNITALESWFAATFPNMAKVWGMEVLENRSRTGECLGDFYEGVIMLTPRLYAYAESLGLTLSYEYDGVGVFAKRDDAELSAKLEKVKAFIQSLSVKMFQLPVEVRIKMIPARS